MSNHLKPTFQKTAEFSGSNESYNAAVWALANEIKAVVGDTEPDGDIYRTNAYPGVSNGHIGQAVAWLQQAP